MPPKNDAKMAKHMPTNASQQVEKAPSVVPHEQTCSLYYTKTYIKPSRLF